MRLTVLAALCALALPLRAAPPPDLQPVPDIPPPPGIVDADLEPQVTITQRGEDRVEEFRIKGRLYLIKVTPSHGKPYFLLDPKGNGQFVRHDDLSPNFQVPMWVILEF
ncbi:MAG TPA: DUF2782 domain-containing protein [Thiobacillaceae bacterium]|nr:DUF2782 domain-containing protein [Thiobacillaceae bacterium]